MENCISVTVPGTVLKVVAVIGEADITLVVVDVNSPVACLLVPVQISIYYQKKKTSDGAAVKPANVILKFKVLPEIQF
jgi:hypothetical protein